MLPSPLCLHTPDLSPVDDSSSDSESDEDMLPSHLQHPLTHPPPTLSGAFCPMRPSLDEVLANTAPAPYTLSAFMAYLSQNHCLETLEFTLDAQRYRESYQAVSRQRNQSPLVADGPDTQHLRMLWQRLLTAYILPGAPRELNVSTEVRDEIVRQSCARTPPLPDTLDPTVKLVHDLMEESIFLPFLNAHATTAHVVPLDEPVGPADEVVVSRASLDEHAKRAGRRSPQASSKDLVSPTGSSPPAGRPNFSLSTMTALAKPSHWTSGHSGHVSSTSADSGSAALTDDSGSLQSQGSMGEPMTPPTTPPSSEPHLPGAYAYSPKNRTENPWKKMGMKLGFKKRSGAGSGSGMKFADE